MIGEELWHQSFDSTSKGYWSEDQKHSNVKSAKKSSVGDDDVEVD